MQDVSIKEDNHYRRIVTGQLEEFGDIIRLGMGVRGYEIHVFAGVSKEYVKNLGEFEEYTDSVEMKEYMQLIFDTMEKCTLGGEMKAVNVTVPMIFKSEHLHDDYDKLIEDEEYFEKLCEYLEAFSLEENFEKFASRPLSFTDYGDGILCLMDIVTPDVRETQRKCVELTIQNEAGGTLTKEALSHYEQSSTLAESDVFVVFPSEFSKVKIFWHSQGKQEDGEAPFLAERVNSLELARTRSVRKLSVEEGKLTVKDHIGVHVTAQLEGGVYPMATASEVKCYAIIGSEKCKEFLTLLGEGEGEALKPISGDIDYSFYKKHVVIKDFVRKTLARVSEEEQAAAGKLMN